MGEQIHGFRGLQGDKMFRIKESVKSLPEALTQNYQMYRKSQKCVDLQYHNQ